MNSVQDWSTRNMFYRCWSEKSYGAVSKTLGLDRSTNGLGTIVNLPRSGWPFKTSPRAQWQLIHEVTKDPSKTSKELQASLTSQKVSYHGSTMQQTLGRNDGQNQRVVRRKPPLTQNNITLLWVLPQHTKMTVYGPMSQKLNSVEDKSTSPATSDINFSSVL